jgi:DNA-binding XRE family transcriptional regulator
MRKNLRITPAELKEARERLDLTQVELAFELGVNRLSVIRWEAGTHRIPPMLTLAMIQLERELCREQDETHLLEPQSS